MAVFGIIVAFKNIMFIDMIVSQIKPINFSIIYQCTNFKYVDLQLLTYSFERFLPQNPKLFKRYHLYILPLRLSQ